jgi:hypothetical protein
LNPQSRQEEVDAENQGIEEAATMAEVEVVAARDKTRCVAYMETTVARERSWWDAAEVAMERSCWDVAEAAR